MDLIKRNRSAVRTQTTKLIRQVDELQESPEYTTQLRSFRIQLEEKRGELKKLDFDIVALDVNSASLEEEMEVAQKYQKNTLDCIENIKIKLQEKDGDEARRQTEASTRMNIITAKLPKIDLPTFAGDINTFHSFWQLFQATINTRKDLATIEKLAYLTSLLRGEAARVIQGFAITEENYADILQILQEKYGNKDRIIDLHITKILNLKPVRGIQQLGALKELVTDINIHLRNLDNLGVTTNACSPVLNTKIKQLLPEELQLEYEKTRGTETSTAHLVKFLQDEIQHRENIRHTTCLNPAAVPFRPRSDAQAWRSVRAPFFVPRTGPYRPEVQKWTGQQWGPRIPFRPGPRFPTGPASPQIRPGFQPEKLRVTCYKCGRPGHIARECRTS